MSKQDQLNTQDEASAKLLILVQTLARELHHHQTGVTSFGLDDSIERDVGLDSLGRVELIRRVEQAFGVMLPEGVYASAETPRDLLRAVLRTTSKDGIAVPLDVTVARVGDSEKIPERAQTLVDVLDWHVAQHPQRTHIQFYSDEGQGDVISYVQLKQHASEIACGLQNRGLEPGDAVALMLPTGIDYFYSFFGVLLAGGVPVPIYPPARPAQLEDHLRRQSAIINNCRASFLITVPEAKKLAQLLKSLVVSLRDILTVEELSVSATGYKQPVLGAEDIAFLQYTSGSTGNPKGVILTHSNLLCNIRADGARIAADSRDIFVSWLPLYHDMGLIGAWLGSLYYGALLIIMSPLAFLLRPQRWLWAIHRYRATLSAAPNFAYELCLNKIPDQELEGLDLSSWRVAFNGAEAVSPQTVQRFCERFSRHGFRTESMYPVYGLAECTVGVSFPPLGRAPLIDHVNRDVLMMEGRAFPAGATDHNALSFVACGYPLPDHEVRVVDGADRELPDRHQGYLQFRGPSATSGYFNNPEATRKLFHDQWLDSGDLAYTAAGDIFITGRTKDIIIRAGRNIYAHELEEAVGNLSGVRKGRVVVFATTDVAAGSERLVVVAETREDDRQALSGFRSRINAVVADLAEGPPDEVVFVPPNSVLKTSSGKIRRAACRELYEQGKLGKTSHSVWWQMLRLGLSGFVPGLKRTGQSLQASLYAAYTWVLFRLLVPCVFVLVVFNPSRSGRWSVMRIAARSLSRAAAVPLSVHGLENLPPTSQPCVYVANHASYLDAYVLVAALPREFSFLAKAELSRNFLFRLFLTRIQTEFVERFDKERGIADARRAAQAALSGRSLMVFAEGTFTRRPGLLPFHMGGFIAAAEASLPVVPVAICGTRSMLRGTSSFVRRGSITVTIGEPIDPHRISGSVWNRALELRDAARRHILRYCGEPDLVHEKSPLAQGATQDS